MLTYACGSQSQLSALTLPAAWVPGHKLSGLVARALPTEPSHQAPLVYLRNIKTNAKASMVAYNYNPSDSEVEGGGSIIQDSGWRHRAQAVLELTE